MRVFGLVLAACLLPSMVMAQSAVTQGPGPIVVNQLSKWTQDRRLGKVGDLTGDAVGLGVKPFSITDVLGLGLCSNSAATTAAYHAICLGHDASGNALVTVDSYGGAVAKDLNFRINGSPYTFPGIGAGNILGPDESCIGCIPTFNNTAGTLMASMPEWKITAPGGAKTLQGLLTVDTSWFIFGNAGIVLATEGNQNGIVGSVLNNSGPNAVSFPTGVTGYAKVAAGSTGNIAFAMYAQCDIHATAGTCTTEIDTSNYSGVPADATLPPLSQLGTSEMVPIGLQVGCGGNVSPGCSIGLMLIRNGRDPQSFITGIYTQPDSATTNGIFIGANSTTGPTYPLYIQAKPTALPFTIQTMGTAVPENTVFQITDLVGNPHLTIQQAGGVTIYPQVAPASPPANTYIVYNDIADSALKVKQADGTVSVLAAGLAESYPVLVGTPGTAAAVCLQGTVKTDASFVYVCTATDTWKRVAIATW